jgi:hypothetical protein
LINLKVTPPELEHGLIRDGIICTGGNWLRIRFEPDSLVFESIILRRTDHAPMDHLVGVLCEDLVSQGIADVVGHPHPPSRLFFGGRESLIRIQIEDWLIEPKLKESGYVLQSAVAHFTGNAVTKGFICTHIVHIGNVFTR